MAVFMQLQKASSQLFERFLPQKLFVRYKFRNKVAIRRNKKRKEDMSWAAELLNYRNNVANKQHEPSPLHLVTKIKPMYGRPKSEKETLISLGFTKDSDHKGPKSVILKNTPCVNNQLMAVKHLLRITPITFPYGVPKSEEELEHSCLNDNGEFVIVKNVTPRNELEMLQVAPKTPTVWDMDSETIKKHTDKIKEDKSLHEEFFTVDPVYKMNQDGKEFRYFGDKSDNGIKHFNERINHTDGSKTD
ncbi:39S ribosomal protein L30, mitochondrial-like [Crassostrea angulata]|uniref:39S ribosomal protein L30, mitochondrial-like n=1 Tax=Magallana angulata TaxID=2784310 RepID=UPI0022B166B7|nr:39S ribosomal protein L30, mitochondrial-like [Crassostrea angulata]